MDRFAHLPWDRQVMGAMLSAVDDAVGAIMSEVEKQGILDNTCTFFTADNGPSRESRNWLDGNQDAYYGGATGGLKGHKFSRYEGGIRVPGIVNWPTVISAGQILDTPAASMDIFPTCLEAAGGDPSTFELDGRSLLPLTARGEMPGDRALCWEMAMQNAIRRGKWKLVLNGQLTEGYPPLDDVHLADLEQDMGEQSNLKDNHPEIVAELEREVLDWRAKIETRWVKEYSVETQGTVTHKTR